MKKAVAQEIGFITEYPQGHAVLTLSEAGPLAEVPKLQYANTVAALITLARNQLMQEYKKAPARPITISPSPVHRGTVMEVKLLLAPEGEFQVLTYFGDQADPATSLEHGLLHAAQVLSSVQAAN